MGLQRSTCNDRRRDKLLYIQKCKCLIEKFVFGLNPNRVDEGIEVSLFY